KTYLLLQALYAHCMTKTQGGDGLMARGRFWITIKFQLIEIGNKGRGFELRLIIFQPHAFGKNICRQFNAVSLIGKPILLGAENQRIFVSPAPATGMRWVQPDTG